MVDVFFSSIDEVKRYADKNNIKDYKAVKFIKNFCDLATPDRIRLYDLNGYLCGSVFVNNIEYIMSKVSLSQALYKDNSDVFIIKSIEEIIKSFKIDNDTDIYTKFENNIPFTISEVLSVKIGKTIEELCKFTGFSDMYKSGVFNKLYPNCYCKSFEDNVDYPQFDTVIYQSIFYEDNPLLRECLNFNIYTVEDYIVFVKVIMKKDNNWKTIVKTVLDAKIIENIEYKFLKREYPGMEWEDEYEKQTQDREPSKICLEYHEYFNSNLKFRAIMLSHYLGFGPFSGLQEDYFQYLFRNEILKHLNLDYEEMETKFNSLSKTFVPGYIEYEIRRIKDEKFKELPEEDLNNIIKCAELIMSKSKQPYLNMPTNKIFIEYLLEQYKDQNTWFKLLGTDIAQKLVRNTDFCIITKETALLMDKEFQAEWQKENCVILDGFKVDAIIWPFNNIRCSITKQETTGKTNTFWFRILEKQKILYMFLTDKKNCVEFYNKFNYVIDKETLTYEIDSFFEVTKVERCVYSFVMESIINFSVLDKRYKKERSFEISQFYIEDGFVCDSGKMEDIVGKEISIAHSTGRR